MSKRIISLLGALLAIVSLSVLAGQGAKYGPQEIQSGPMYGASHSCQFRNTSDTALEVTIRLVDRYGATVEVLSELIEYTIIIQPGYAEGLAGVNYPPNYVYASCEISWEGNKGDIKATHCVMADGINVNPPYGCVSLD